MGMMRMAQLVALERKAELSKELLVKDKSILTNRRECAPSNLATNQDETPTSDRFLQMILTNGTQVIIKSPMSL